MKFKKSVFMLIVMLMGTFTQLATSVGTIHAYAVENETEMKSVEEQKTVETTESIQDESQSTTNSVNNSKEEAEPINQVTAKENEETEADSEKQVESDVKEEVEEKTEKLARAGGRDITGLDNANLLPKDKNGRPTILTDVSMTLNNEPINELNALGVGDMFQIVYKFEIPDAFGKEMLENDYYEFQLPSSEVVELPENREGDLIDLDNGIVYGKYYAETNGNVKMVFNDKVSKNDDVDGELMFSMKVDEKKITIPGGYEIEIPFVAGDNSEIIYVTSNIKSYIQKQYNGLNGDTPEWKILINPNSLKMNDLKLEEKTTYRYSNKDIDATEEIKIIKMKKAKVNLKGDITEGEEVSVANHVFDSEGGIDLGFNQIDEPYVLYVATPLKFGVKGNVTNKITLKANTDNGNYIKEDASASQQLGKDIVKKEVTDYDKKNQTVDWKITYNPEGVHIPQDKAYFKDTISNGTLVEDSVKVSPNLAHEVKVFNDKKGFDFIFNTDVNEPVIITYKVKVSNMNEQFVSNEVVAGGQKVIASKDLTTGGNGEGDGDGDGTSTIVKNKPIDYQGGVLWELDINKERQQLEKWWVEDSVDSGKIRKSSLAFKILPGGQSVNKSDYTIEWKDIPGDSDYATGFKINYNKPTNDYFFVSYVTEFERNTDQTNQANYHYVVEGNEKEDSDTQTYVPKKSAEIGLAKSGSFIPEDNEIEWTVVVNDNEKVDFGPDNLLIDPIKSNQTYVENSAKTQYKVNRQWFDFSDPKISFNKEKNQVEVRKFMENKYAQRLVFRTKLKNPLDIVQKEIENTAYYQDKYTPQKSATGTLKGNIGNDLFLKKEGKQNLADPNLIDWHVDVNPHGYHLRDLEIFDDSWENQVVLRETIKLEDSSGNQLIEGTDYLLEYTERRFHIKMLHDIKEKLDLTYQGRITLPSGTIPGESKPIKNKIRMTARDIYTTENPIEANVIVKVPDSSGIIQGKTRNLNVKKVSAENQNDYLAGAEFVLYRGIIKDQNKVVDHVTSNGSGDALFTKLTKGDYLLVETKAPVGYGISEELKTGRVVKISDSETTQIEEIVVNSKGGASLIDIPVEKKWNKVPSGIKTPSVTVRLFANGVEKNSLILNEQNNYQGVFKDLPEKENDKEINYVIKEDPIDNYDSDVTGGVITNTYNNQEKTNFKGKKIWDGDDAVVNERPSLVKVQLLQNGNNYGEPKDVYANEDWQYEFTELPKVNNETGEDYLYSVKEIDGPKDYESSIVGNNIKNTYIKAETISVEGEKIWQDNDDRAGKRPDSVEVILFQDGQRYDSKTTTPSKNWAYKFENLPKQTDGKVHVYSVKEGEVKNGYTSTVDGYDITNTYTDVELVSVSGKKKWEDKGNEDKRPEKITVQLLKNGDVYEGKTQDVTESTNWEYSFTNLPKYDEKTNKENIYTVDEVNTLDDYVSVVEGTTITNYYEPTEEEVTTINGKKIWEDNGNKLKLRPSNIIVNLFKEDKINNKDVLVDSKTVTGSSTSPFWSYEFDNLPKTDPKGNEIVYFVEEKDSYSQYESHPTGEYDITNSLVTEKISISGQKEWYDDEEKDRPENITVNLYSESKNNEKKKIDSQQVTAKNNWQYTFSELDKYDSQLDIITYTVDEEPVEGYTTKISGTTIKNYLEEDDVVNIKGEKKWVGDEDYINARPKRVLIQLFQNNNNIKNSWVYPDEDGRWFYEFLDLPKKDASGNLYEYRVEEYDAGVGYTSSVDGYDITNTFSRGEFVDIKGKKYWNDFEGTIGKRPDSIQVELQSKAPSDTGWKWKDRQSVTKPDWEYEFKNQPKYNLNGELIEYRVVEIAKPGALEDYESTSVGVNIVNTVKNKKTKVEFIKNWQDEKADYTHRPEDITVHLLQDGTVIQTKKLTEKDNQINQTTWSAVFDDLDVYNMKTGEKYVYTFSEDNVPGYDTEIASNQKIVNRLNLKSTVNVVGEKFWEDNANFFGNRPNKVIIELYQNDQLLKSTETSEDKDWKYSFEELPEYDEDNKKYTYTVKEEAVPGYETQVLGYDITNIYKNTEVTSLTGEKIWEDYNNKFDTRPTEITVNLYQNNKLKDSQIVKPDNNGYWKYKFENLQVKDDKGNPYHYRVEEDKVPSIYESEVQGNNIVNKYMDGEKIRISGEKTWDDYNNKFKTRPSKVTVILFKNGKQEASTVISQPADSEEPWKYSFEDLEKRDETGELYEYEVKEVILDTRPNPVDYETEIVGNDIINHYVNNKTINFSGEKKWKDYDNKFDTRPEEVTVYLLNGNKKIDEVKTNEKEAWKYEFNNEGNGYPVYDSDGEKNNYCILEKDVQGYTTEITVPDQDIEKVETITDYNLVNTYVNTEKTSIKGNKTWEFIGEKDHPDEIEVTLYQGLDKYGESKKVTEADNWEYAFTDLPAYDETTGDPYVYTVKETPVDGYIQVQGGPNFINRSEKIDAKTSLEGQKIWEDKNNELGKRPGTVNVVLYRNNLPMIDENYKPIIQAVKGPEWTYKFEDLEKYDSKGEEFKYSVREIPVSDYKAQVIGNNIVNTYENNDVTEVLGKKIWDDHDNKLNSRPEKIVVELYQNNQKKPFDTREVDESNDWEYAFRGLPKYDDNLTPYTYTVKEKVIPHYEASYEKNNITNTYINDEKIDLEGEKIWLDMDNKLNKRPSTIKVELYQDNNPIPYKEAKIKGDGNTWSYKFKDLPKYNDDLEEHQYTVKEIVDGTDYQSVVEGNTIFNTYQNTELTNIKGTKRWEDFDDKLNKRPDAIYVYLYRNEGPIPIKRQKVTPDLNGYWSYEFKDLPKYDKLLNEYNYQVKEGKVKEYTGQVETLTPTNDKLITNTYKNNDLTEVNGYKAWLNDGQNKLDSRPELIKVDLYQIDPDNQDAETKFIATQEVTPDEDGDWFYSFKELEKYNDKLNEYIYEVKEQPVDHYESKVEGNNIINTYKNSDTTEVEGEKKWVDLDNKLGQRPGKITVELYQNDKFKEKQTVESGSDGKWTYKFGNLPKYDDKLDPFVYTVKEPKVPHYQTEIEGTTITNYYQNDEKTKVSGKKVWDDKDDKLNLRPTSIQVDLYQNNSKRPYQTKFVQSNQSNEWTYEFDDLPKYDDKLQPYVYTVKERKIPHYEGEVDGTTIVNTYDNKQVTGIKGEKIWNDQNDKLGVRPTTIYVDLYQGDADKPFATETVEADENGKWEYEFVNLPKHDDNLDEYQYHIKERHVVDYDTELGEDGTTITNTYRNDDKININGEKKWEDYDNKLKKRPKRIKVDLYQNNEKDPIATKTVKSNLQGHWRYSFRDLPKYDDSLDEIKYTVKEQPVKDYDSQVEGTVITNVYQNKDTTEFKGEKQWDDKDNKLNVRPESIHVNLHQNNSGEIFETQVVTPDKDGNWYYEFKDLPKYDKQLNEYQYSVTEEAVPHYSTSIEDNIILNSYINNDKTKVMGRKIWKDEDNKLNIRPNAIKVELYQNEGKKPIAVKTVRAGKDGNWGYEFTNLPKYDDNYDEYRYTVKEQEIPHYEGKTDGNNITNTYINDAKTEINGEKKWEDYDNKLKVRPKTIKVDLYQNGTKMPEKTEVVSPDKNGNWYYSFKDLPKHDKQLNEYQYTVKEQEVAHYESQVDGTTITNTYKNDEMTLIKGEKIWQDKDNKLDLRPTEIKVDLYQNNVKLSEKTTIVRPDEKGNWNYVISDLPKYDKELNEYEYTVKEQAVPNYSSEIDGTTITNTYENTELTSIKGEKQWNDSNNHLNTRPDSIKIDLYQNDVLMIGKTQEVKADESGKWFYEFTDLPKYDNSLNEYQYTVKEQSVTDYRSLVEGTTIVNTYKNEKTINLKGKKEWQDFGNKQNTRPESIHVELYQNDGEKPLRKQEVKPNEAGEWFYEFKDLPQYDENLNEFTYTVKEKNVPHYESHVEGTTITNTYQNTDKTTIKGEKQWRDEDNKLNTRPEFIQVELYQNGVKMEDKTQQVTPDKKGKWYYEFTDLPKYDAELNEYKYTVKEQKVSHYDGKVNESNTLITNTYRNDELTKISGQKLWKDDDNKYQTRPDLITVELYQNDSKVPLKTQQVKPNKAGEWLFEFKDLPKYDSKLNEFKYTLKEVSVKNYTSKVEGTTITNTLTKETEPGKKPKPFLPNTGSLGKRPNRLPKTGEVNDQPFLTALMGLSLITFAGVGIFFRRKN
ncbi:Cna B-type domain-containing protein [Vagococcus carniphilus]|uniref:Cna B-type domain-containing protein n=1 Tax=Vagococcus carniphilus TaxID=218144 RepID=UPI00288E0E37|nr:Cna B-type domain-containing protein [Vagococcus carniphilus]MDT2813952.1 Cna B-type domain-containing protein [Vagococcus carniphilus]